MLLTVQVDISIRHNDRVIRRMWPRLRISISRMGFSAAGRRSALPIQPARGSSVIFGPTTERADYHCEHYPWYDRVFVKANTQIEYDVSVWRHAETLIRSDLAPVTARETEP